MTSDDLGAVAAIAIGAVVAIAATVTYLETEPLPVTPASLSDAWQMPTSRSPLPAGASPVIMAGPENARTGWSPPPDDLGSPLR